MTSLMAAYPKPISGHFTHWFPDFPPEKKTRDRHKKLTGWQHHRRGTVRFHTVLLENFLANRRRNHWKLVGYFERLSRMGFLSSIGGGCLELHVCIYLPTVGCCTNMYQYILHTNTTFWTWNIHQTAETNREESCEDSEKAVNTFATWQQRGNRQMTNGYQWEISGLTRFSHLVYLIAMAEHTRTFWHTLLSTITCKLIVLTSKHTKAWYLQQAAYWNDLGFETLVPAESDSFDWGAADIEKALRSFLEAGGVLRWVDDMVDG